MLGSWPSHELPNLHVGNCEVTSPATNRYNCIAWAAAEDFRWWWPDPMGIAYWPPSPVSRAVTMQAFMEAYQTIGFTLCLDGSLQEGIEKIAIFGTRDSSGGIEPTHASLQLNTGHWTSKLGTFEDIRHETVNDVDGPIYGRPVLFMSRPRPDSFNPLLPLP
jgi:hypothetical protein